MSVSKLVLLLTSGIVMVNSFPNVEPGLEDSSNTGIFVVKDDNDNATLTMEQESEECAEDEWSCHQKGIKLSNCTGYSCVNHMTRCVSAILNLFENIKFITIKFYIILYI